MEFTKFLSEALDITNPVKSGKTPAQLLKELFDTFGQNNFSKRDMAKIAKSYNPGSPACIRRILKGGYIKEVAKDEFNVTSTGVNWLSKNSSNIQPVPDDPQDSNSPDDVEDEATGVKDISKLRTTKFIVPRVGKNSKYIDQMKTILSHMKGFANGTVKTTYMLAGDPGTGKTSFIKSLSNLTGIPLVVIEAPHITQEHLINIPFLVIDGPKTKTGNLSIDDSQGQMKVVQSESNLVTQLKSKTKRSQDQIMATINRNKILKDIYPLLEKRISKVSGSYNSILFLDEFYRTSSMKIRNVLRNILNGKIGNDKIPQGVYIIMATNINDDGVEDIPLNQDFHIMNYDVSSKEDFMSYMFSKFVDDENGEEKEFEEGKTPDNQTGISIKPEVWNKFMEELTDSDLGFTDNTVDVRLSPRRLEQIIICVDAMLPVNTQRDAQLLLAFINTNLSNYMEEKSSDPLMVKFTGIIFDLINSTKPKGVEIDLDKLIDAPIKKSEWRDELQSQIELKMKLGDNRKYVPVVSGQPGIGKTTQMSIISKNLEMGFIQIDVSNLTPEDITGMPIADMSKGDNNITTKFSEPNLYISIMKEYNEQIKHFKQEGRKYNIILLFDEMNRASVPVFNSIRKVLLEKEFEHVKLPDDIIVTGAINPKDVDIEFTSHTRDVLDIIPSGGNFTSTLDYIKGKSDLIAVSERLGFNVHEAVTNIMAQLAMEFKSETDTDGNPIVDVDIQPFWWYDGSNKFYISPREMTEAISNAVNQIEDDLDDMDYDLEEKYTEEDYENFITEALNTTAKTFVSTLEMVTLKQDINGFTKLFGRKIVGNDKFRKAFEGIRTKRSANIMNLVQILKSAEGDINFFDKGVIGEYIKSFSSTEMVQDIAVITDEWLTTLNPNETVDMIIKLADRLIKSLDKLNASANYSDQVKKYCAGKIIGIFKGTDINLIEIISNDKMMQKLEGFM